MEMLTEEHWSFFILDCPCLCVYVCMMMTLMVMLVCNNSKTSTHLLITDKHVLPPSQVELNSLHMYTLDVYIFTYTCTCCSQSLAIATDAGNDWDPHSPVISSQIHSEKLPCLYTSKSDEKSLWICQGLSCPWICGFVNFSVVAVWINVAQNISWHTHYACLYYIVYCVTW